MNHGNRLRIATRESPLAMWQAEWVRDRLQEHHPGLEVELLGFTTRGDKLLGTPLSRVGGKGLFIKELEDAMLRGDADIAVHSMKDVPMDLPEGLAIASICEREDPRDAFVSNQYDSLASVPVGGVIGTSSLRRRSQLLCTRPDLEVKVLRGNENTRLPKLDAGEFDAIILATAGLLRLGFQDRIRRPIETEELLPSPGQGAVGIEARDDDRVRQLLAPLHHPETALRVECERAVTRRLGGGCQLPIAAHAVVEGTSEQVRLEALVAMPDGSQTLFAGGSAPCAEHLLLADRLADELFDQGAQEILESLDHDW